MHIYIIINMLVLQLPLQDAPGVLGYQLSKGAAVGLNSISLSGLTKVVTPFHTGFEIFYVSVHRSSPVSIGGYPMISFKHLNNKTFSYTCEKKSPVCNFFLTFVTNKAEQANNKLCIRQAGNFDTPKSFTIFNLCVLLGAFVVFFTTKTLRSQRKTTKNIGFG